MQAQQQWSTGEVQLLSSDYTADGLMSRQTVPVVVAASGGTFDLASWDDPAQPAATLDYDLLGRLLAITQPVGRQATYSYRDPGARYRKSTSAAGGHHDLPRRPRRLLELRPLPRPPDVTDRGRLPLCGRRHQHRAR